MSDFKVTDEHIEAMLRYLTIFHPEQANKEFAESWLRYIKAELRQVSLDNLDNDALEKYFEAFQKSKG